MKIGIEYIETIALSEIERINTIMGVNHKLHGNIVYEQTDNFCYIYFESVNESKTFGKRYYQLVYNAPYLIGKVYEDSNCIDLDKSYSIEDLKNKFKNYIKHVLNKINEDLNNN